jgi:hypothetical protein
MGAVPRCPDCGRQLAHWNDPRHLCAPSLVGKRFVPEPRFAKTPEYRTRKDRDPNWVPKQKRIDRRPRKGYPPGYFEEEQK